MKRWRFARALLFGVFAVAAFLFPASAPAQVLENVPQLDGVGITEHLNERLPLELPLVDESGAAVRLGDYFVPGRPVMLFLVYYNCPMLCNLVTDAFVEGIRGIEWVPGKEYEIVTVSIDPSDTPAAAKAKRDHQVENLGIPGAAAGWHFLTGTEADVRALAKAIGFSYRYDPVKKEYLHAAAVYVATPEGVLSRYLYGVQFDPATVRLSLVEASNGKIGGTVDQILLYCFAYDHTAGRYGPAAFKIMRLGAGLCVVLIGCYLAASWIADARRRRAVIRGART